MQQKTFWLTAIAATIFLANFAIVNSFRCLDCNDNNKNCKGIVVKTEGLGVEPCNTRCFLRTIPTQGNTTYRGCDIRYDYKPLKLTIPDNGCAIVNGERWCWCDEDMCNMFDQRTISVFSGGYNNCLLSPCKENETCKPLSLFNGDYRCQEKKP